MLTVLLRYLSITLCSIYTYIKLQRISSNKKQIIFHLLFSLIFSVAIYFIREYFSPFIFLSIVFFLIVYLYFIYKKSLNKTISFTIISVAISYICFTFSIFITAPVCYITLKDYGQQILNIVTAFICGFIQISIIYLLFKIKRLSKGIEAYESKLTSDLGVFISISLLVIVSFYSVDINNEVLLVLICFIVLSFMFPLGLLLLFWWRKHITNIYLEKVNKRNTEILENSLSEQKEITNQLKKQNEELSKIIHRDNKMIPAMEMAVEEILNCQSPDEQKTKSKSLIGQLKTMSSERTEILTDYETSNKRLPETGIASLDASLKYLFNKATKSNISFDLSVTADVKKLATDIINENDLNTLILDLAENAVIATSTADNARNILTVIGMENQSFCINIYDSGNQFEPRVISNLGLRRVTTHKKTGGSGIGLMTTLEMLKKYKASFIIDEISDNESYRKKVSVCFDGYNQYRIHSQRNEILRVLRNRTDIISF